MKNHKILFLSIFVAMFLFVSTKSIAQYCEPYFYYAGNYMGINNVKIADLENATDWPYSPGYNYYQGMTANMAPGEKVNLEVTFGNSYDMGLSIWIDWNQDGYFDDKSEMAWNSGSDQSASGFSGSFTVPSNASLGYTRMRVMCEYYYMYSGYPPYSCAYYQYGEAEDYDVFIAPPPPDAAMVSIDNPTTPFSLGFNEILATFTNKNDNKLESCDFSWFVNNTLQGVYHWTGTIKKDEQIQLSLGNYDFQYPPGGPYNAFNIRVIISNQNGDGADKDYGNDAMSVLVAPVLNDAGVIGFFGPPEGFGPGVTAVRARVMNYAPKPLNSVRIRWAIDGVEQPSFTATGLNIPYLGYQDIVIGNYTFYNKTPMGPFTVKTWTEVPNGVVDEVKGNDEYNGGIGPSFVPGIYTIGGYGAHFNTLTDASSYLSASGVMGTGAVYFEIRPGTYKGQVLINANLVNNNTIEFRSSTGRASDVVIEATPTNLNNYLFRIDGMKNIYLKNLSFRNTATNTSLAGNILVINNGNNINADYCNFYGVASAPRNAAYTNLTFNNTNMANITNCIILNGAIGITNQGTTKVTKSTFDNNIISDYTWKGINNSFSMPDNNVIITNNVIRNTNTVKPPYGIASVNGTTIKNNIIDGLTGTGTDTKESGIYVSATSNPTDYTDISNNRIINVVNANGVLAENGKVKLLNNLINGNLTVGSTMSLVNVDNTVGYAGNNVINGGNITGLRVTNSPNFHFVYNSVVNNSVSYPSVYTTIGSGSILRNIFQNYGTGLVADFAGTITNDENNYFTKGTNLLRFNGVSYTLPAFVALGYDKNSSSKEIFFEDVALNNLKLKTYIPELLKGTALSGLTEPMNSDVQKFDYEGHPRASFFIGSDEIKLEIKIQRQSEGIVDCIGTLNTNISVSATMSYGVIPTYQWEKDGVVIAGQTKEILTFAALKLSDNGVYRCLLKGPGDTKAVYSEGVTVYVLTPTEITEEPKSQYINMGGTAIFQFAAHINGRKVEDALKMNEISIQWYKVKAGGDITIVDDKRIAGAKSNLMTITNYNVADEGQYYAVITGLCGTATTSKAELKEAVIDLTITEQPIASTHCEGETAEFKVEAVTQSVYDINYQWYKDGQILLEGAQISGTKASRLRLYEIDANDAGDYYCMVTLENTALFEQSAEVKLTVNKLPSIVTQPTDVTVQVSKDFTLTIELDDENDVTFEWFFNGKSISTEKTYTKTNTQPEDAGKYWCVVTNSCGDVKSTEVNVVVTTGTVGVTDKVIDGYILGAIYPNPSMDVAEISYTMPNAGSLKISVADISGREVMELLNETVSNGTNTLKFNVSNLPNGVYYIVMNTGTVKLTQRLTVVK